MKLIQRNRDAAYLQYDKYVDFDNPMVMEKAMDLTKNCRSVYEKIETIYYFVKMKLITPGTPKIPRSRSLHQMFWKRKPVSAIQRQIC